MNLIHLLGHSNNSRHNNKVTLRQQSRAHSPLRIAPVAILLPAHIKNNDHMLLGRGQHPINNNTRRVRPTQALIRQRVLREGRGVSMVLTVRKLLLHSDHRRILQHQLTPDLSSPPFLISQKCAVL